MTVPADKPDATKNKAGQTAAETEARTVESLVKSGHPEAAAQRLQADTKRDASFGELVRTAIQQDDRSNGTRFYPSIQLTDGQKPIAGSQPEVRSAPGTAPPVSAPAKPSEAPGAAAPQAKTVDMDAMLADAQAIRKATGNDNVLMRWADKGAINNILQNKTEAERKAIDQVYKTKFGIDLESEMRKFEKGSDLDTFLNVLHKQDNNISNQNARRLHEDLIEHTNLLEGRSDSEVEKDIRTVLGTLNSDQVAQIQKEYLQTYGVSLRSALACDLSLSKSTRESADLYLQSGNDKRTDGDTAKLIDIALKGKDAAQFAEVMSCATASARKAFMDNQGEQRLTNTFGHWYSNSDLKHAMDMAVGGKLDAATQVGDNTHWINNTKGIELTLKNLTDDERKMYDNGKSVVAGHPVADLSYTDSTKAKEYYTRLHSALVAAGNATEVVKWEDMITSKGEGSFIAALANHRHTFWFNDSTAKITDDIRGMSQTDWQSAKQHPEWRDELRTMLRTLNKSTDDINQTLGVYDKMVSSATFGNAAVAGKEPVLEQIDRAKHFYGNDSDGLFNAVKHMSADEQSRYKSDADFRKKVDDALIGSFDDPRDEIPMKKMLALVQDGKAPTSDLSVNLYALRNYDGGDKNGDAVDLIEKAYKDDPSLRERLLHPTTDADKELARRCQEAARQAFGFDYERYGKPLLEQGELSLDKKLAIEKGVFSNDYDKMFDHLTHVTPEEKERLQHDPSYQKSVLGFMDEDRRKIAMAVVDQGQINVEDKIRNATVGWGGSSDIVQYLKSIKPEELEHVKSEYARKYGRSMEGDLFAKLGGQDKVEAERVFSQNLGVEERVNLARTQTESSRSGFGAWVADSVWRSGTGAQADNALDQTNAALNEKNRLSKAIADGTALAQSMTPEQQVQMQNRVNETLAQAVKTQEQYTDNHVESKKAAAEYVGDGAIAVVAIGSMILSGGADTPLVLSLAAWGAGIKLGTNAALQGNDYDWSVKNVATDVTVGAVTGVTSVIGPGEVAAVFGVGKVAAEEAAATAITLVGEKALATGGRELLENGTKKIVYNALASGAKKLEGKQFLALAEKAIAPEITGAARTEAVNALAANLQKNVADRMATGIVRAATHHGLNVAGGGLGGGAGGMVQGATQWDSRKTLGANLSRIATSTEMGALSGAAGGGVMSLGMAGLGATWKAGRSILKGEPAATAVARDATGATTAALTEGSHVPVKPPVQPIGSGELAKDATAAVALTETAAIAGGVTDEAVHGAVRGARHRNAHGPGHDAVPEAGPDAVPGAVPGAEKMEQGVRQAATVDAPLPVADRPGRAVSEGDAVARKPIVRDLAGNDGLAGDKPAVRQYRVVEGQEAIARFRASSADNAGMVKVREVHTDGSLGEVKSIYLEHRTGPSINHAMADTADIVATCDPAKLPANLRGKFPLSETDGVYLAVGKNGDEFVLSTPEAFGGTTSGGGRKIFKLGEYTAADMAMSNAADRAEYLDGMSLVDYKNVIETLDAPQVKALPEAQSRELFKDVSDRLLSKVQQASPAERQEALRLLIVAAENDEQKIATLWHGLGDVNIRDVYTPAEMIDLSSKVLAITDQGVTDFRRAVINSLRVHPDGDPAMLNILRGDQYGVSVMVGLNPPGLDDLLGRLRNSISESFTAENIALLPERQRAEAVERFFTIGKLQSERETNMRSYLEQIFALPREVIDQIPNNSFNRMLDILHPGQLVRNSPPVRDAIIDSVTRRLEAGHAAGGAGIGPVQLERLYNALGSEQFRALPDPSFGLLLDGMSKTRIDNMTNGERNALLDEVQRRLSDVEHRLDTPVQPGEASPVAARDAVTERALVGAKVPLIMSLEQDSIKGIAQYALSLNKRQLDVMGNDAFNEVLGNLSRASLKEGGSEEAAALIQPRIRDFVRSAMERTAASDEFKLTEKARFAIANLTKPETLRELTPDELSFFSKNTEQFLDDYVKKDAGKLKETEVQFSTAQTFEKSLELINEHTLDRSPLSGEQLQSAFAGMNEGEQKAALDILQSRRNYMSVEGMRNTFRDLAASTSGTEGLVRDKLSRRLIKEVNVLVTSDSSAGRELAYEFRKSTGIGLNFHVLRPGEPIPSGKWLMFDKPPAAGDPLYETFQHWSAAGTDAASTVTVPKALEPFYKGPNLFDTLGNTTENARFGNSLKDAVRAKLGNDAIAPGAVHAVDEAKIEAAKDVLSGFDQQGMELRRAQTLLMLAHETNRKKGVVIEALARLLSMPEVNWHISPTEQLANFRTVRKNLSEALQARGQELKNAIFITDADAQGSSHSATYLFRLANAMEDAKFDSQFMPLKGAAALKDIGNRPVVYLDDIIYTGKSVGDRAQAIAKALKIDSSHVTVAVGGVHEAGRAAVSKRGIQVVYGHEYVETYQALKAKVDSQELSIRTKSADGVPEVSDPTEALKTVIGEGWKGEGAEPIENPVTSSVSTPVMVANNSSPLVVKLAQYHGLARANMVAIEAETEAAKLRFTQHTTEKQMSKTAKLSYEVNARRSKSLALAAEKARLKAAQQSPGSRPRVAAEGTVTDIPASDVASANAPDANGAEIAPEKPPSSQVPELAPHTAPIEPATPVIDSQLREFRQSLSELKADAPSDADVKFALDYALDGHEVDPSWKDYRSLRDSYLDKANPMHALAQQVMDTQVAAARLEKSPFGEELRALWAHEFGGKPSDDLESLQFALDFFNLELSSQPEAASILPYFERLRAAVATRQPIVTDMALEALNQILTP